MTTEAFAKIEGRALSRKKDDPLSQLKRWWLAAFLFSATLGSLAGVTGIGINALFLFQMAENKGAIGLVGVWLLLIAFPLLFLSAHCLDKIDSVKRQIRLEYCREHGFDDDCRRNDR